jgi:hypothetical protein
LRIGAGGSIVAGVRMPDITPVQAGHVPPSSIALNPHTAPVHLTAIPTVYTVSGTTEPAPGSFTNKDAMLAFVRAHLPHDAGTVTIAIHRRLSE